MTTLDAQSKDAQKARIAIIGLLSRGAYIKAFHEPNGRGWKDFHLIIDGQRHEGNRTVLLGIAESGKATIIDNRKGGFVCFHATNLSMKGRHYA